MMVINLKIELAQMKAVVVLVNILESFLVVEVVVLVVIWKEKNIDLT